MKRRKTIAEVMSGEDEAEERAAVDEAPVVKDKIRAKPSPEIGRNKTIRGPA